MDDRQQIRKAGNKIRAISINTEFHGLNLKEEKIKSERSKTKMAENEEEEEKIKKKNKTKKYEMMTEEKREQTQERTGRVLCLLVIFVYGDRDRWSLTAGPLQRAS